MLEIRRSADRGHADHGWLEAFHTFSFADYHDPAQRRFGVLRVINQDRIQAQKGFAPHDHRDMEIVTYVLEGELAHQDSLGNGSTIRPGEVQLMSAGSGVTHSEFNASKTEPLHLLQMWVFPRIRDTEPRYEQKHFPEEERRDTLRLVVSPDGAADSLRIGQDARLFAGLLAPGRQLVQELSAARRAWFHLARGRLSLNGVELGAGDGVGIERESELTLRGIEAAEFVLWDLPGGSIRPNNS